MRFRKKPVEIDAVRWTGFNYDEVQSFVGDKVTSGFVSERGLLVHTLEGTITARVGDWIIKGIQGEFYPCKPDIFEQTYEPVESYEVPK